MKEKIADKMVELRLATRKACMCESADGNPKNTLSLKSKFLYCLRQKALTPADLMDKLMVGKTNLAIMARAMIADGLIVKIPLNGDLRLIQYELTEKGRTHIQRRLDTIERAFVHVLTNEKEYRKAVDLVNEILRILSFL